MYLDMKNLGYKEIINFVSQGLTFLTDLRKVKIRFLLIIVIINSSVIIASFFGGMEVKYLWVSKDFIEFHWNHGDSYLRTSHLHIP